MMKIKIKINQVGIKINLPGYTFEGESFSLPTDNVNTWTPLSYFKMFWKHDLNVPLAEQTNIYSVQKTLNTR